MDGEPLFAQTREKAIGGRLALSDHVGDVVRPHAVGMLGQIGEDPQHGASRRKAAPRISGILCQCSQRPSLVIASTLARVGEF